MSDRTPQQSEVERVAQDLAKSDWSGRAPYHFWTGLTFGEQNRYKQAALATLLPKVSETKVRHMGAALRGIADNHIDKLSPREVDWLYEIAARVWDKDDLLYRLGEKPVSEAEVREVLEAVVPYLENYAGVVGSCPEDRQLFARAHALLNCLNQADNPEGGGL